jgi:hypothetical protein
VLAAAVGAAGALALIAPAAQAGPVGDAADCSVQRPLSQPFLPWADLASYALSPNGGLETGASGWTLSGSATTGPGNESYYVGGDSDNRSLSVPAGSSATSDAMCVGLQWPTIRFFARSSGTGLLSLLKVDVVVDDALSGQAKAVPIGVVTPTGAWQPSLPMVMIVNNLGALTKDGMLPVAFRFTPVGSGTWQVDDLYVDPWRGP